VVWLNVPVDVEANVMVPVGVTVVPPLVSVTVAVQVPVIPTVVVEGTHTTATDVERSVYVMVTTPLPPWLPVANVVPTGPKALPPPPPESSPPPPPP
jgi:hypothetical protein